jgi:hypothetical protein
MKFPFKDGYIDLGSIVYCFGRTPESTYVASAKWDDGRSVDVEDLSSLTVQLSDQIREVWLECRSGSVGV